MNPGNDQARLLESLSNPALYGPLCTGVRLLETHISYVLLTGRYAYKIKKAVSLHARIADLTRTVGRWRAMEATRSCS